MGVGYVLIMTLVNGMPILHITPAMVTTIDDVIKCWMAYYEQAKDLTTYCNTRTKGMGMITVWMYSSRIWARAMMISKWTCTVKR